MVWSLFFVGYALLDLFTYSRSPSQNILGMRLSGLIIQSVGDYKNWVMVMGRYVILSFLLCICFHNKNVEVEGKAVPQSSLCSPTVTIAMPPQ